MSRLHNEAAALPPFTDDPVDRLRHTLAAYHDCQQDRRVLTATQNALGSGVWTGLTIGDLQALIAEVERLRAERDAVLRLHQPEKRYQPHPDCEFSLDTAEEAADWVDGDVSAVTHFVICAACGELEMEQTGGEGSYCESMWPCATARALGVTP